MSDQLDVAYWREQVAKEPSIIGAGLVASLDEILRLRADYWREREANSRLTAERDEAQRSADYYREAAVERGKIMEAAEAERDALLPVVEAARAWRANVPAGRMYPASTRPQTAAALVAAVDALDHTPPETALSATQSAEEGAGAARGVGGARGATGLTGGGDGELDLTEAIEAAAGAIDAERDIDFNVNRLAEAAVRAAAPIIERAVREAMIAELRGFQRAVREAMIAELRGFQAEQQDVAADWMLRTEDGFAAPEEAARREAKRTHHALVAEVLGNAADALAREAK